MPPVHRILVGLCLAVAVIAVAPSAAQESAGEITAAPDVLNLPLNKARVFELSRDARDVLVSNPAIADVVIKTPRLAYVLGQQVGDTNVFFFDAEGKVILRLEIRVELDLTGLRKVLAEVMPDERIRVTAVNENIVLTGTARSAKAAEDARLIVRRFVEADENIVNMVGIHSEQQVLLRVRVAEIERTVLKDLGFRTTFQVPGRSNLLLTPFSAIGTDVFSTLTFNIASSAFDQLNILLDAVEKQGLANTLAEPSLTAVSGENANLLVGGEIVVVDQVTVSTDGTITIQTVARPFGVILSFTPVVLGSGLISLKLSTEVSKVSTELGVTVAGIDIPGFTINRAETTVELASGGSIVIAGLLQNDLTNEIEGIPGLKDIPILGALFRSERFQKEETELIIAVTPYLVSAVSEQTIALPTDGFAPASDFDLYLLGRLHGVYANAGEPQPDRLMGPIGYIME